MRLLRRAFLRGALALSAWLAWPLRRAAAEDAPLFTPAQRARLAELAALILPAWQGQAAAGGGDFAERFERLARSTPDRPAAYREYFERFLLELDARVSRSEPPDAAAYAKLFEVWHAEWRRDTHPSFQAQFFELLRRDVLRTYYASPAGWKSLHFTGPAHRAAHDA